MLEYSSRLHNLQERVVRLETELSSMLQVLRSEIGRVPKPRDRSMSPHKSDQEAMEDSSTPKTRPYSFSELFGESSPATSPVPNKQEPDLFSPKFVPLHADSPSYSPNSPGQTYKK